MSYNVVVTISRKADGDLLNTIRIGGFRMKKQAIRVGQLTAKNELKVQERIRGYQCASRVVVIESRAEAYR